VRVWVDDDACAGTGLCELTCPEVFEVGVVARVLLEEPARALHDQVREAAEDCPTGAIHVEELSAPGE
jgi:ferredoxin